MRAAGSKTTLDLSGYYLDRAYLSAARVDERDTGFTFTATRQLRSNLSADFDLGYTQYERSADVLSGALDGDSRDTHALLRLNRKTGRTLTFSAEAGYTARTGELPDADGWWVGLRTRWSPSTPGR